MNEAQEAIKSMQISTSEKLSTMGLTVDFDSEEDITRIGLADKEALMAYLEKNCIKEELTTDKLKSIDIVERENTVYVIPVNKHGIGIAHILQSAVSTMIYGIQLLYVTHKNLIRLVELSDESGTTKVQ